MNGLVLVVMAAGVGSRYGGLKQVEPVGPNGEWIVDYSVYDAVRAGFGRILFVVREEIEEGVRARFDPLLSGACEIEYVVQRLTDLPSGFSAPAGRSKPWGTGHALWSCRGLLNGPFAAANADDFYGREAFTALAEFLSRPAPDSAEHALVGYRLSRTLSEHGPVTRGVCRVEDGLLAGIEERRGVAARDGVIVSDDGENPATLPADAVVSMNLWGFGGRFLGELSRRFPQFLRGQANRLASAEYLLPEIVGRLVEEGRARVRVLSTEEMWFGMTYPADLAQARRAVAERIERRAYPANLWTG